jgi:hypothetical protein
MGDAALLRSSPLPEVIMRLSVFPDFPYFRNEAVKSVASTLTTFF